MYNGILSSDKRDELSRPGNAQMNFYFILLNERSQSKRLNTM
jgi:hypothetical protein